MSENNMVSVVIPVFNEESNLEELIRRCLTACSSMDGKFEIIFVDDGSKDKSPLILKQASEQNPEKIRIIVLNRNYGQHSAVLAGFAEAAGEIVVTLDADLQNPPEEIPKLVAKIKEGHDVVGSVRVPRNDSLFRKAASLIINLSVRKVTGVIMHDYGCMLRAYRKNIVEAILQCNERSTFIPVLANIFAASPTEVEVSHSRRLSGESKYDIWKLLNLQFDLMTSMTTFPLRLLSIFGGIISFCGISFGLFLMAMRVIHGAHWAVEGVFTLFAILFVFIGAQFIGMGLLGEYLGRVYHDVRARPRYFVKERFGGKSGN
ncbi:MAG: glycosyltransferase [Lentisphaerota bacterium]